MVMGGTGSSNNLLGSRYRILRELGRGGFGYTYLAEDVNRFNELCVLKEFLPQVNDDESLRKAKQLFEREADVLYQLNHPQIPKFRELLRVKDRGRGRLFLVQDYVEGPTYQELLETRLNAGNRFAESEVIQLLQRVLPVLSYLHSIGVIHRDIAPDNLISRNTDGLPVLIDFGGVKQLATVVQQQVTHDGVPTRLGKAGYAPEEQMESGQVSPSSDLYALAVTALVLLTGQAPDALYDRYTQRWRWQDYVTLSPRLATVLERMLAPRVGDRYSSATAVAQALASHDLYPTPGYANGNRYPEPTVAVAPGRGTDPSTMVAAPGSSPAPIKPPKQSRPNPTGGCFQAFFGLLLLIGSIGLVWWIATRWEPNGPLTNPEGNPPEETQPGDATNPTFSPEEQARKAQLRQRRERLQVDERYLVAVTDQLFYSQFAEIQRPLSDDPADAELRAEWDGIANEVLDVLEAELSAQARQRLGSYGAGDRDQWRQRVNPEYVSTRALYDLTDAKFAYLYPQAAQQNFIDQPIGQIWHGLADDRVRGIESGELLEEIRFASGEFSQSLRDRLGPGEGRIYILNLSEGQLMRLNLQAAPDTTRLSIYVPSPDDTLPFLLEDSRDRTWSGTLPQSGYYEITVVNTQTAALNYALDVSVDNVTSTPTEPAPAEDKN
ncbi:serine/threonine-protein kinase [Halomicronema sp. CCY15110]|uniref:serine/threonine-protein kinase n=1 Tax=Halomicronema sp. CCY15110 TaxID=2767773 RepID=UPI001950A824|nr:serine/threonine-protein kinase [Halomicronema sp. CCY15110]